MIGIYKITNPNGRIYIGQSTNIKKRWKRYKNYHCKDQPSIYKSLIKYGSNNHIFEIIEECLIEELEKREIYWGEFYNVLSSQHLNNRLGNINGKFSMETRRKMNQDKKGVPRTCHINAVIESKSKPIKQLDLQGNLIKEWKSGKQAANKLNINQPNINIVCNGKGKTYKGFIWKFKEQ